LLLRVFLRRWKMKKTELTHSQEERGVFTILHYFLLTAADSPLFQATFLLQPPFSVGGLKRSGKKDFGGF